MFGAFCTVRTIAQFGSALDWGSRGRWFESSRPDQKFAGQAPSAWPFLFLITMIILLKATMFPLDVITESKRVHQPPKSTFFDMFGG